MTAAMVLTRTDTMPSFTHELDEVHTPSSDYSFAQPNMLSSNASGIFPYCQTGPADLGGSSWDTTVEGPQNFPDFADTVDFYPGDTEDYGLPFGQITPKPDHMDAMDDLHAKWNPAIASEAKAPKAEPMRRVTSRSSTGSYKHRSTKTAPSSSKKSRTRVQSILSASSQMSKLDMSGNASAYQDGSVTNGPMMDMQQYLVRDLDTLSVSSHVNGPAFFPDMMGFPDGLHYPTDMGASMPVQHVNPQIFDAGLTGNSPQSWGSLSPVDSRMSSPGVIDAPSDDVWSAVPSASSPGESQHSNSPTLPGQSPRYVVIEDSPSFATFSYILGDVSMNRSLDASQYVSSEDLHANGMAAIGDDGFALPPAFNSRRMSGDGESSARDHYLYKTAYPSKQDGLFHCPWEGQQSCNHKPEKLKCNYDKFVDSHLKPYRCKVEGCQNARFSSTACLLRHEREAHAMHGHGEKPYLCSYEGCERSLTGHGFPRQWNLRDHMRRVHNDNGTVAQAASPPPPTAAVATSTRGRKRKSENQEKQATQEKSSSRKSSTKAASDSTTSTSKIAEIQANADFDQWYEHQKALQSLVQGCYHPDDPRSLQYIKDCQERLTAMGKISHELVTSTKAEVLGTPFRRSWKG